MFNQGKFHQTSKDALRLKKARLVERQTERERERKGRESKQMSSKINLKNNSDVTDSKHAIITLRRVTLYDVIQDYVK